MMKKNMKKKQKPVEGLSTEIKDLPKTFDELIALITDIVDQRVGALEKRVRDLEELLPPEKQEERMDVATTSTTTTSVSPPRPYSCIDTIVDDFFKQTGLTRKIH
jgi:hypothetical protein